VAEPGLGTLARLTWAAAASALARGDVDGFAAQAREAALFAAAAGDGEVARGLADVRGRVLQQPPSVGDPSAALAAALVELGAGATDPALAWHYARALVAALPLAHPLVAAATALGWTLDELDVVLAVLAAGDVATMSTVAMFGELAPEQFFVAVARLAAGGAIRRGEDDRLAAEPSLVAACAGRPSPFVLAAVAGASDADRQMAAPFDDDGVVVIVAPTRVMAMAGLRDARVQALGLDAAADAEAAGWIIRDARWRRVPVLVELTGAPDAAVVAAIASVPRAIVIARSASAAAAAVIAIAAARGDVRTWSPPELAPAESAERLAAVLAVPADRLRVGHLHATDVEDLAATVIARGDEGVWELEQELRARAAAELMPFVFLAAPELPGGVVDRARELLVVDGGWGWRVSALVAPLLHCAPLALALAADRGVVAATLALGMPQPGPRMERALSAARRWGAVLCVGIDRAHPTVIAAFAHRLVMARVPAVIGLRPGTPVPPSIAAISATLTI
jgi:hypothetical protein